MSKVIPWILLGIVATLFVLYIKGCFVPKPVIVNGPMVDSGSYWKNKYDQTIFSLRATKEQFSQSTQIFRDSIANLLNTKAELIDEVTFFKLKGKDTVWSKSDPVIVYSDTGHTQVASASEFFVNPWYQIQANIDFTDKSKSFAFVQTFDSLILAWKTVTTGGFFNKKSFLQLDIKNSNPFNLVTSAEAYRLAAPPPKKWGIGLFVGYGYGFVGNGSLKPYPIIGAGLTRTFIRF